MDVHWFVAVKAIEEEAVRTRDALNGGHVLVAIVIRKQPLPSNNRKLA
jgi:hypothetical protein